GPDRAGRLRPGGYGPAAAARGGRVRSAGGSPARALARAAPRALCPRHRPAMPGAPGRCGPGGRPRACRCRLARAHLHRRGRDLLDVEPHARGLGPAVIRAVLLSLATAATALATTFALDRLVAPSVWLAPVATTLVVIFAVLSLLRRWTRRTLL